MKRFIISNWKEYITSAGQAGDLLNGVNEYLAGFNDLQEFSLVFCPQADLIPSVADTLVSGHLEHQSSLGMQDMLESYDERVRYLIIGHSDRRWKAGDSDEVTNTKLKQALAANLIPIVCIGEKTRDEHFRDFLKQQIDATFAGVPAEQIERCMIAYEPVWAISSTPGARPDTVESALESLAIIKQHLNQDLPMLDGGSVTADNVEEFLKQKEISGVLIGHASTNVKSFTSILEKVRQLS